MDKSVITKTLKLTVLPSAIAQSVLTRQLLVTSVSSLIIHSAIRLIWLVIILKFLNIYHPKIHRTVRLDYQALLSIWKRLRGAKKL
jgi:hypothetical protein